MSRLTKSGTVSQRDINKLMELSDENQFGMNDVYYRLKEYEDLEERGLLIKLPSTEDVYCIENIIECKYDYSLDKCPMYSKCGYCGSEEDNFISCKHQYRMSVIVHRKFNMNMLPKLGKSIFFTREDAEKELERRLSNESGIK